MTISESELSANGVYFTVTYADSDMLFPIVRSLVFLGKNVEENEKEDRWYFQDTESYAAVGPYPNNKTRSDVEIEVHRLDIKGLTLIFDLTHMCQDLSDCLNRHASAK